MQYLLLVVTLFFTLNTFSQEETTLPENELIPFKSKDKWGATNKQGELIISAKYDNLAPFFHNVTKVNIDGKYGIINTKQKEIVPVIYDEVSQITYSKSNGLSYVCKKDNKVMLQVESKVLVPLSENFENISIVVDSNHYDTYYILSKKQGTVYLFNVIDSKGKKIIENVIADKLDIVSVHKEINNYYVDFYTNSPKSDFYWWSEAKNNRSLFTSEAGEYNETVEYMEEAFYEALSEMDGDYDEYEDYFQKNYNKVSDFKDCFIYVKKKQSRDKSTWAYYTLEGKALFNFSDRVEKISYLTKDLMLVQTYDDELNCKKPTKYGVYNLKTKSYTIQPNYYFQKIEEIRPKRVDVFDEIKMMETLCERIDELKEMYSAGIPKSIITQTVFSDLGIDINKQESIIILANDNNLKVLNEEGTLLTESTITEGVFIAEEFLAVKNKDSIYVGIEVFNNEYRGKGIIHVNSNSLVVKPLYSEIENRYNSITLYSEDMQTEEIKDFDFPINSSTAKIGDSFVKALSKKMYLVSKKEDKEYALYSVENKKVITDYIYTMEYNYPKVEVINNSEYFFLKNKEGNYSVINQDGKLLVPSSTGTIEVKDIYNNKNFYFITNEGYYGIDGTTFFKQ